MSGSKRPDFGGSSVPKTAALKWYERTPKWKMAIMLQHLAAVATGPYDDALEGQWFDKVLEEAKALEEAGCFRGS